MLYSCCMGSSDEEDFITDSVVIADSASMMPWLTRSGFWSLPQLLFSLLTSLRAFWELKVLLRWCGRQSSTPWCTIGRRPLGSRGSIMEPIRPLRLSKITERCSRKIRSWPHLIHLDHQPNVISIMTPYNSGVAAVGDICIYRKQFLFCTHSALQFDSNVPMTLCEEFLCYWWPSSGQMDEEMSTPWAVGIY